MSCLRFNKGNPLSRATSEEVKKNAEIDKIIRKDKKAQAKNVKILLLGPCCPAPQVCSVEQLLTWHRSW